MWTFLKDGKSRWEKRIRFLQRGDWLKVYDTDEKTVLFEGKIRPDEKTGWAEYPRNPGHGQPCLSDGLWIHWTQRGWKPDDWAALFIRKKEDEYLRAELVPAQLKRDG